MSASAEPALDSIQTVPEENSSVYYFCYGSNMLREKLVNRTNGRGPPLSYNSVKTARLRGWCLCFDLRGAPPNEPAMGSIHGKPGDAVYGLVYEFPNAEEWARFLQTEGVRGPPEKDSYHVIDVEVECFEPDNPDVLEMRAAQTLISNPGKVLTTALQEHIRPSQRYLNILIEGAEKERLPAEYVERLKNIRVARKWGPSPLLFLMRLPIPILFMSRSFFMQIIVWPLRHIGFRLYAMHEGIMYNATAHNRKLHLAPRLQLALLKVALFLFYSLYIVPSIALFALSPTRRRFYRMLLASSASTKGQGSGDDGKGKKQE